MIESDFERKLRHMQPASCDQLASETFYRAGWAAAERSQTQRSAAWQRPVASFATGLLCGLMVLVATRPTPKQTHETESVMTKSAEAGEKTIVVDAAERESADAPDNIAPASHWQQMMAEFSPLDIGENVNRSLVISSAEQPLSPVARRCWSGVVISNRHPTAKPGASFERETLLRPFSATEGMFDDLL